MNQIKLKSKARKKKQKIFKWPQLKRHHPSNFTIDVFNDGSKGNPGLTITTEIIKDNEKIPSLSLGLSINTTLCGSGGSGLGPHKYNFR